MKIIIIVLWIYMIFISSAQGSIFTVQQPFNPKAKAKGFVYLKKCQRIDSNLCHLSFKVPSGLTYTVERIKCVGSVYNNSLSDKSIINKVFESGSTISFSFFSDVPFKRDFECVMYFYIHVVSDTGLESLEKVHMFSNERDKLTPKEISIDIADKIELRPNQEAKIFEILSSNTGMGRASISLNINFDENNIKSSLIQLVEGKIQSCSGEVNRTYTCVLKFDGNNASWYGSKIGNINILLEIK